jgi:GH25 family lysozyme M1 (1,4-beta-N-acetylmuramidase)/LysM repeat protein
MIKGIDVSRWQGLINWPTVKVNVDFAMIKIGGSDDGFYQDGQAVRNALEARSCGLPVGFYVYLGGASATADEVNHIKNLISNIGGLRPGEILALDWEEHNSVEVQYVYEIAKGLIDAGINPPLIYMSLSRVTGNNWSKVVGLNCGLWVAAWGNNDTIADATPGSDEWPFWAMWQYSSTGSVPGISGRVDLDYFQGSVEDFKKYGGVRGITLPAPVNTSRVVAPFDASEYVVVAGDNLSAIAARSGHSWQELWNLNRDRVSNPNMIFPGLKLRIWALPVPIPDKPSNPDAPVVKKYTVVAGDNLSSIAQRLGYPSYIILWEANKGIIPDPNLIRPGQELILP